MCRHTKLHISKGMHCAAQAGLKSVSKCSLSSACENDTFTPDTNMPWSDHRDPRGARCDHGSFFPMSCKHSHNPNTVHVIEAKTILRGKGKVEKKKQSLLFSLVPLNIGTRLTTVRLKKRTRSPQRRATTSDKIVNLPDLKLRTLQEPSGTQGSRYKCGNVEMRPRGALGTRRRNQEPTQEQVFRLCRKSLQQGKDSTYNCLSI